MSEHPYMQLYVADYLGDTQHLTTEQHGAYLLLLMAMWRQGGALPNDQSKLARIARVSLRRWHLISSDVMAFFDVEGNLVVQKRLKRELEKAASISEKRSASGKLGAEVKALKNKDEPLANGQAKQQDRAHVPEPLPVSPPTPPSGGEVSFERFWEQWPGRKVDAREPAEWFFGTLTPEDRAAAVAAVGCYVAEARKLNRTLVTAKRFLVERRWENMPAAPPSQPVPETPKIYPGTSQWEAWEQHFRTLGKQPAALEALARMHGIKDHGGRSGGEKYYRVPSEFPPKRGEGAKP